VIVHDVELVVIPTEWKSKLPQTLSYPLGAEMLSKAFAGVPQFDKLKVRFWFYSQARPETLERYSVLEIDYRRPAKSVHTQPESLGEDGLPKLAWSITVRPVPRIHRNSIRTQLRDVALPQARLWLEKNAGRDAVGSLGLVFTYDEEAQMVTPAEEARLEPRRG
jgi:hypothetical protein